MTVGACTYRVYLKRAPGVPFKDAGIIESNRPAAEAFWADLVKRFRYAAFRLEPITYGVAVERT